MGTCQREQASTYIASESINKIHTWCILLKFNFSISEQATSTFKPFLYARLDKLGLATTIKQAKRLVEKEKSEVWVSLEHIIRENTRMLAFFCACKI